MNNNLNRKALVGIIWVVSAFSIAQVLRLGSNLVVTRLLEPEMFGIMAVVAVIMQGFEMISDLGLWACVVRFDHGTESRFLNTVWTIQVIRGWAIFGLVTLSALSLMWLKHSTTLVLNGVYGNDEFPLILIAIGFMAAIRGYKTMAPAILSRELKRGKLELVDITSQISGISLMILLAWKHPSIWALVSAGVMTSITSLILNYRVFPFRHNLAWDKAVVNEVYHYGKWIVLASILTYLSQQGDRLFFAGNISAAQLGVYSIAFMLSSSLSDVIQQLCAKIWFPVLSKTANTNRGALKETYYKIRFKQDMIVFIVVGGVFALAPKLIELLYDDRYYDAGWMLQLLIVSTIGIAISSVGQCCLSALGNSKIRTTIMFVRSLGILIGLPLAFHFYGFVGALWVVALNVFPSLPILYFVMYKNGIFSWFSEIKLLPMTTFGYLIGNQILKYI